MDAGDIVFFKRAKPSLLAPGETLFVGHGFGIMLGIAPPGLGDPPGEVLHRLTGQAGFLRFDDLAEFFGPELAKQAVEKYNAKYHRGSGIIGLSGRPLKPVPFAGPTKPDGGGPGDGPKPL